MKELSRRHRGMVAAIISTLLFLLVAVMAITYLTQAPASASAEGDNMTGMMIEAPDAVAQDAQAASPVADDAGAATPADDCTVTIRYLEYADYEDPDAVFDDQGRRILGTRTITGLSEGSVINAWSYVVDIPGHFFYDGWPQQLTVSTDPSQNVIELIYMSLYNSEYTVNYYVMTGADLSADTWSGALSGNDVRFYKMGSETFDNQRFDALIDGDAYEYKLNDMYVIDTYPAQIRLGTDADNNVINVLYTPDSAYLPDDMEVPDEVTPPDVPETPTPPDDEVIDYDHLITVLPDDKLVGQGGDDTGTQAPGTDDSTGTQKPGTDDVIVDTELKEDFLGSDLDRGELQITDEMLANPVSKDEAEATIKAYQTGLQQGANAQTGDTLMPAVLTLLGIALVAIVVLVVLMRRDRSRTQRE